MKWSSRLACAILLGSAVAALSTAALGYGGGLGRDERDANGNWTDFKNPLPTPDPEHPGQYLPHHYHVTICNNGSWYGYWVPPEWQGVEGDVHHSEPGPNQHGYAKASDGTEGGLQVMGNGKGDESVDVTLTKGGRNEITLTIRVIPCDSYHHYNRNNPHGIPNPQPAAPPANRNHHGGGVHMNINIGIGIGGGSDWRDEHHRNHDRHHDYNNNHDNNDQFHSGDGHVGHSNSDLTPPRSDMPQDTGPHD